MTMPTTTNNGLHAEKGFSESLERVLRDRAPLKARRLLGIIEKNVVAGANGMFKIDEDSEKEHLYTNAFMVLTLESLNRHAEAAELLGKIRRGIKRSGGGFYYENPDSTDHLPLDGNSAMVIALNAMGCSTEASELFGKLKKYYRKGTMEKEPQSGGDVLTAIAFRTMGCDSEAAEILATAMEGMKKGENGLYYRQSDPDGDVNVSYDSALVALALLVVAGRRSESLGLSARIEKCIPKDEQGMYCAHPDSAEELSLSANLVLCLLFCAQAGVDILRAGNASR
jgi:hypothetical protein